MHVKVVSNYTSLPSYKHKIKKFDFSEYLRYYYLVLLCMHVYLLGQLLACVVLLSWFTLLHCFYMLSEQVKNSPRNVTCWGNDLTGWVIVSHRSPCSYWTCTFAIATISAPTRKRQCSFPAELCPWSTSMDRWHTLPADITIVSLSLFEKTAVSICYIVHFYVNGCGWQRDDVIQPAAMTTSGRHYLLFSAWPLGVASDFCTTQSELDIKEERLAVMWWWNWQQALCSNDSVFYSSHTCSLTVTILEFLKCQKHC